ncbi:homoserine O-succinyltransferase [Lactiplantibacillus xiangfangensis]|uniref:Homoserine O-acetyltransferase n=1 Tax=Lactiplantibacillus xiangfangensis TaxID=942150 RepID=A0A0R2M8Z5_9LACO|nr:homoserine O-succinyltransferase [Lactiplantibacillus xiangfangensis]KRO07587.1 homoserine o-succinyltransferase [Lactiplantibacillus xiangfangensis]
MAVTAVNGLLKAQGQWDNAAVKEPLQVLILNLMPNKQDTERQFLQRLAAVEQDVAVTFMYPVSHHFKSLPKAVVAANYVSLNQVIDRHFDGLIVTGAPVEQLDFEAVDYWDEFLAIISWAQRHVTQTLFECWAAQAGLYAAFNVQKQEVSEKIFGIYTATAVDEDSRLTRGLSTDGALKMPQSRHTQLILPEDLPADLHVVATNNQVGPLVLNAPRQRAVYVTGHPEYEATTLANEYFRDRRKHLPINLPQHYFKESTLSTVDYSWPDASRQLYQNWLATLDLAKVGLV